MIDFKLNSYIHKPGINMNVLYHGSPVIIKDNNMTAGTFFTVDKTIATDYGKFIYSIELDDKLAAFFQPDTLREHLISSNALPMYLFTIEQFN